MNSPPDETEPTPKPSYRLHFKDCGDYLRVEISGPGDSLETSLAYWREIAAECQRRATQSLLVVDALGGQPIKSVEMDQVIRALSDSCMKRVRVAYCELSSAYLPEAEYGELSAREIGYTVRVFAREDEAQLWLRYGEN